MRETKAFANACKRKPKLPSEKFRKNKFILQWHITEHCNLSCKHCYQDNHPTSTPSLSALLSILRQFYDLLAMLKNTGSATQAHINLTGGEPFLNASFIDLLELLYAKSRVSYAILTNGTLIDVDTAVHLKKLQPSYVQVSIEGRRDTHDEIRGEGSYQKAVTGIGNLVAAGVPVYLSFTVNRNNYKDFPDVVRCGRKLGVSRIWADRLIPCGNASSLTNDLLTPKETLSFFEIMKDSRKNKLPFAAEKKDILMHRALQFLVGGGEPYHCSAGDTLITILPNGDVLPCRRMPVVVGNVCNQQLLEIYSENSFLKSLRDKTNISKGCEQCFYKNFCRGGLKCLSHAVNGDQFYADPGCWIANNQKTDKSRLNNLRSL